MQFQIKCLVILAIFSVYVASIKVSENEPERFLFASTSISFATFTLIKTTTTSVSTFTSMTTCTTSTATLTTCTIGRRRRGLFYDESSAQGRNRRGLFYNDDEVASREGADFLPVQKRAKDPSAEVTNTSVDDSSLIPLQIDSGFALPQGSPNRFLLAIGTSTVTSIVISTSTISLTAICSSTTGFPLCGNLGK